MLKILMGPSDQETDDVFYKMTPDESLFWSIKNNLPDYTLKAIERGADLNVIQNHHTPLMIAISEDNMNIIKILLEHGADINKKGHLGMTALMWCIHFPFPRLDIIDFFIKCGADLNIQNDTGETILIKSSGLRNHLNVVDKLIKANADINIQDKYGCTALYEASYHGNIRIVRYLVENGADINLKDIKGNTPYTRTNYKRVKTYFESLK